MKLLVAVLDAWRGGTRTNSDICPDCGSGNKLLGGAPNGQVTDGDPLRKARR